MPQQVAIIAKVNQYLVRQGRSFRVNEEGNCNGLSVLFLYYCAHNQLDDFKQLQQEILDSTLSDDEMDRFIQFIEMAQRPKDYPFGFNQDSYAAFLNYWDDLGGSTSETPFAEEFNVNFVYSREQLLNVLQTLLQAGKLVRINCPTHAGAIYYDGETYYCYDPNRANISTEQQGVAEYASIEDVEIEFIEQGFFHNFDLKTHSFSVGLGIISNPHDKTETSTTYPARTELLAECLAEPDPINISASDHKTPLYSACLSGHADVIHELLSDKTAEDIQHDSIPELITLLAYGNHGEALETALTLPCIANKKQAVAEGVRAGFYLAGKHQRQASLTVLTAWATRNNIAFTFLLDRSYGNGKTLLHDACESGNEEFVSYLVDAGATIDVVDNKGYTPLYHAVINGKCGITRQLLDNWPLTDANAELHALSRACIDGDETTVRAAAQKVNSVDECIDVLGGIRALHIAYLFGNTAAASVLVKEFNAKKTIEEEQLSPEPLVYLSNSENKQLEFMTKALVDSASRDSTGNTMAHYACQRGHISLLDEIIKSKPELLDVYNDDGETPLFIAIKNKALAALTTLKQRSDLINYTATNNKQQTILHVAAKAGSATWKNVWPTTSSLGADSFARLIHHDENHESILHSACRYHNSTAIQDLLANELVAAQIDNANTSGDTPLHLACAAGDTESVELLLEEGASTTLSNANGDTALHIAAGFGEVDIISQLLSNGSHIEAVNNKGHTPLFRACRSEHLASVGELLENNANPDGADNCVPPLYLTTASSNLELTKLLLQYNASHNRITTYKHSASAMQQAVNRGNIGLVRCLLQNDMVSEVKDQLSSEAFRLAYHKRRYDIMAELVKHPDVDPNVVLISACKHSNTESVKVCLQSPNHDPNIIPEGKENTLFQDACLEGNMALVTLLLSSKNIVVDRENKDGKTTLQLLIEAKSDSTATAAQKQVYTDMARLLIGIHPNQRVLQRAKTEYALQHKKIQEKPDDRGLSLLHIATANSDTQMLEELLLSQDIHWQTQDYHGRNVLHLAVEQGHVDIVRLLLQGNIDIQAKDNNNKTPYDLAIEGGNQEIQQLLWDAYLSGLVPPHDLAEEGRNQEIEQQLSGNANESGLVLQRFIAFINNTAYWKTKTHFSVGPPTGIKLMQEALAQYNADDLTAEKVHELCKEIATNRFQKRNVLYLLTTYNSRDLDTEDFYGVLAKSTCLADIFNDQPTENKINEAEIKHKPPPSREPGPGSINR